MEKQLFLEFRLRFNLRQTKVNKPTIIYVVYVLNGTQYKTNSGVKVYPSQWDNRSQSATISNRLSYLDNKNNQIVNEKISIIRISILKKMKYLCNQNNIDNIIEELSSTINPNLKHKKSSMKKLKITTVLSDMAYKYQSDNNSEQSLFNIKKFKKYLDINNIEDDITKLDGNLMNDYQQSLVEDQLTIRSIDRYVRGLKTLINYANKDKSLGIKIDISELDNIKDKRTTEQRKSKNVPLTEEQLLKIHSLKDLSEKEEEAKDLFICQSLLGQRISDMPKIFQGDYTTNKHEDGIETISFNVEKTKEEATIYLFPLAYEIIEKYRDKEFKYYNLFERDEKKLTSIERTINQTIKSVCKKAGLDSEINYTEQIGEQIVSKRKPLYDLMHTHIARHTFITLMCKMGVPKDIVIIATAHTDTKMIEEVYLHETPTDKGKKLLDAIIKNNNKSSLFTVPGYISNNNLLNDLFAYDLLQEIANYGKSNNDIFHYKSTYKAIEVIKDITKLKSNSKDVDRDKIVSLEQIVFELSYYFRDVQLYSVYKFKEKHFGITDYVPSHDEVEALFVEEDIERPKKQLQTEIEDWEDSHK